MPVVAHGLILASRASASSAEMRMGEMLKEIPKATPNNARKQIGTSADLIKPKKQVLSELGIKQDTAERFQQMAEHPELVKQAIAEARKNDDIVSRAAVLKKIKEAKRTEREQERLERKEYTPVNAFPTDKCNLFAADIRGGWKTAHANEKPATANRP